MSRRFVPMSALRAQGGREREAMRRFAPFPAGHPSVGGECAVCGIELAVGDVPTIIPLGPGPDPKAQLKAQSGGWYSAISVVAHADCAGLAPDAGEPMRTTEEHGS